MTGFEETNLFVVNLVVDVLGNAAIGSIESLANQASVSESREVV